MCRPRSFRGLLLLAALGLAPVPGAGTPPPHDPRAAGLEEEALKLAARDDAASLERALKLLDEAGQVEPRFYPARADRALVGFLRAAARREEGRGLESGEAHMQDARELRERALERLRPLVSEHPSDPAVVRALALYYGLDGHAAQTRRLVKEARAAGGPDAWIDLAEMAARLREATPEAAIPQLAAFAAVHPQMMRVRMMLARRQLELGRAEDALSTLDELLAANPEHDRAKELKASILSPPPARLTVVPTPPDAPPPQPAGYLPRKPSTARGPGRDGQGDGHGPSQVGRDLRPGQ